MSELEQASVTIAFGSVVIFPVMWTSLYLAGTARRPRAGPIHRLIVALADGKEPVTRTRADIGMSVFFLVLIELLTMVVVVDAVGRRPPDLLAASIAVGIWVGELTWILVVASNSEPASTP